MAAAAFPYDELEIIGYADALTDEVVPSVVAPVYRLRGHPGSVIMPPYRSGATHVEAKAVVPVAEFAAAVAEEEATALAEPLPARPGHLLWIDIHLQPHYGPAEAVRAELRKLAQDWARQAQLAFASGDHAGSQHWAQRAVAADDRCLNAVLITALVEHTVGRQDHVRVLARLAAVINPGFDLQSWLELYSRPAAVAGEAVPAKYRGLARERPSDHRERKAA